ncbi:hypothetical protein RIF29_33776 [Crotalaria pallida]|uniref:Uncharacterized protein n=1 Tax=Crotalaria pallida TaxID=3830 RepID=A0AAN9E8H4_CROPI
MRLLDGKVVVHAIPGISRVLFNPDLFEALQLRFRYKIKLIVKDSSATSTFCLLDRDARSLVGYSVHELFEMTATSSTALSYTRIEDSLVNRLCLFKVAVKVDSSDPSSTIYSSVTTTEAGSPSLLFKNPKFERGQSSGALSCPVFPAVDSEDLNTYGYNPFNPVIPKPVSASSLHLLKGLDVGLIEYCAAVSRNMKPRSESSFGVSVSNVKDKSNAD